MIVALCWALLALIHALPALALLRPALITRLYGVAPGSETFLLLHHRAALFLVVVILCLWAMLRPEVRPLAAVAVAVSMVSFLLLWRAAGAPVALRSIALADLVGLLPLAVVAVAAARSGGAA
jgi:hypothetical protein